MSLTICNVNKNGVHSLDELESLPSSDEHPWKIDKERKRGRGERRLERRRRGREKLERKQAIVIPKLKGKIAI